MTKIKNVFTLEEMKKRLKKLKKYINKNKSKKRDKNGIKVTIDSLTGLLVTVPILTF